MRALGRAADAVDEARFDAKDWAPVDRTAHRICSWSLSNRERVYGDFSRTNKTRRSFGGATSGQRVHLSDLQVALDWNG